MGNRTKIFQDSMSLHNVTNPDKLKLTVKYTISKFYKCKSLVGKILTIQHELVKFIRLFYRQSFTLYGMGIR